MRLRSRLSSLLRNLFRSTRIERELDDELSAYLDAVAAERIAAGVPPDAARRQARVELGGREQVKEQVRAIRSGVWLETAMQDLRVGVRQLRHAPGFTLVVALTLGVGIGASTAVFTLAHALFLRPTPVVRADRLVHVSQTIQGRSDALSYPIAFADYIYFRDRSRSFAELAAHYSGAPLHFVHDGEPAAIFGGVVTHNYFASLGLTPALGRFFSNEEDTTPGRAAVAVIADEFWERRFSRNPHILGATIHLNDVPFSVIGVAPRGFQAERQGQVTLSVWIPSAMFRTGYRYCDAFARGCAIVSLTGRLNPGVTLAAAQSELDVLSRQLQAAYPKTNAGRGVRVDAARGVAPDLQAQSLPTVRLLAGMVAVVLAISCANVAGLLFVRGIARRREVALRLALGAGRSRVIRQLLTESMLLAVLGGTSGLLIAHWLRHLLVAFYGVTYAGAPLSFDLDVNATILAFTLGLSLITGLVFGVMPAFQASSTQPASAINDAGMRAAPGRSRVRDALVVIQVALSIVLLVGAGLLVRSVQNIHHGPGFDPRPIVLLRLRPSLIDYDVLRAWAFQRDVQQRMAALPGVEAVSPAVFLPLPGWGTPKPIWIPGQEPTDRAQAFTTPLNHVGPDYFRTLGLPILEGRPFTDRDDRSAKTVAIVNQTLARHFWPDGRASGRAIVIDGTTADVVGVVRDAEYRDISQAPMPFLYLSYAQQDVENRFNGDSRTHIRVSGDPAAMLPLLRRTIAAVDRNVPISEDLLLSDRVDYHFRHVRAVSTMLVTLGAIGALLSAVALYAVLSLVVRQRTREIAIRMALGARQATVSRMVVRQGFALCAAGAGLGLIAAVPATQLLRSVLFGVTPGDPSTWLLVACLLVLVGGLACYLPARHAARVEPTEALKEG